MALSENMIAALVGLLGAAIGAWAAWWSGIYASRWSRTLDMHREFNSERLSESRSKAFKFLREHWGLSFTEIAAKPELDLESVPLWDVMRFYQRLAVAVKHKQVIRRVVPDLFGEIFLWWYLICFRQQLQGTKWVAAKDIETLYWWMNKKADRASWSEWNERHENELNQLRATHSATAVLESANTAQP